MANTFSFDGLIEADTILDHTIEEYNFKIFKGVEFGPSGWANHRHIVGFGIMAQVTKFDKQIPFIAEIDGVYRRTDGTLRLDSVPTAVKFIVDYDSSPKSRK